MQYAEASISEFDQFNDVGIFVKQVMFIAVQLPHSPFPFLIFLLWMQFTAMPTPYAYLFKKTLMGNGYQFLAF